MSLGLLAAIVIFVIGAVTGTILRFKVFLLASSVVGAVWATLVIFSARGSYPVLLTLVNAVVFVILMLVGAAIGRTLKNAFLQG